MMICGFEDDLGPKLLWLDIGKGPMKGDAEEIIFRACLRQICPYP